jgi:hypothetical protein
LNSRIAWLSKALFCFFLGLWSFCHGIEIDTTYFFELIFFFATDIIAIALSTEKTLKAYDASFVARGGSQHLFTSKSGAN